LVLRVELDLREAEAHAEIDDRHHLAAVIGDARDLGRRVRQRRDGSGFTISRTTAMSIA
jgi:YD repeat-containing protein